VAWDYKVIDSTVFHNLEPQIQQAAREEWEVTSSGGGDNYQFVILRRPK